MGAIPSLETLYLEYNPLASDFEYRKKLAQWIPTLQQIDATMIGGLAAHGVVTAGGGSTGSAGGGTVGVASGDTSAERLRQLQAAAIERAKRETEASANEGNTE